MARWPVRSFGAHRAQAYRDRITKHVFVGAPMTDSDMMHRGLNR